MSVSMQSMVKLVYRNGCIMDSIVGDILNLPFFNKYYKKFKYTLLNCEKVA